ncbi:MAG: Orotate phosphoribosyltransferase [Parcubacteria group bacterium GW2011_GWF2_38_8]|nr:MAG: Orotate phosphoribosyltransferase [Parcubacteria group bacterium GW2011_GWF2_38_8]
MEQENKVVKILLKIGAIKFSFENPITFKSGIVSPIYMDNRKLPFHPEEWKEVLEEMKNLIQENNLVFDIIAGVEAGGIPHSAGLGLLISKPSVFVRKKAKEHGTKSMIEGGEVKGKKVLLVEDLVSTGISSLASVKAIREEGGEVNNCLAIASYGFEEGEEAFKNEDINLISLVSFADIIKEAEKGKYLDEEKLSELKKWFSDPRAWKN